MLYYFNIKMHYFCNKMLIFLARPGTKDQLTLNFVTSVFLAQNQTSVLLLLLLLATTKNPLKMLIKQGFNKSYTSKFDVPKMPPDAAKWL